MYAVGCTDPWHSQRHLLLLCSYHVPDMHEWHLHALSLHASVSLRPCTGLQETEARERALRTRLDKAGVGRNAERFVCETSCGQEPVLSRQAPHRPVKISPRPAESNSNGSAMEATEHAAVVAPHDPTSAAHGSRTLRASRTRAGTATCGRIARADPPRADITRVSAPMRKGASGPIRGQVRTLHERTCKHATASSANVGFCAGAGLRPTAISSGNPEGPPPASDGDASPCGETVSRGLGGAPPSVATPSAIRSSVARQSMELQSIERQLVSALQQSRASHALRQALEECTEGVVRDYDDFVRMITKIIDEHADSGAFTVDINTLAPSADALGRLLGSETLGRALSSLGSSLVHLQASVLRERNELCATRHALQCGVLAAERMAAEACAAAGLSAPTASTSTSHATLDAHTKARHPVTHMPRAVTSEATNLIEPDAPAANTPAADAAAADGPVVGGSTIPTTVPLAASGPARCGSCLCDGDSPCAPDGGGWERLGAAHRCGQFSPLWDTIGRLFIFLPKR